MSMTSRLTDLQGIHALVVDDDQVSRHFVRSILEFSGAVVTATAATDALRAALIADVVVCDLESAQRAGSEFLAQLQQLHVRLGRPVPIMAMVPAGTRRARVHAAGFASFLLKPVDGDELRAAVSMARWLE
jgi:CheY-like chemotaxis protein